MRMAILGWLILATMFLSGYSRSESNGTIQFPTIGKQDQNRQEKKQLLLTASWIPFADSKYQLEKKWETLRQLKPKEVEKAYSENQLAFFLPPADAKPGEIWKLDVEKFIAVIRQFHAGATHRLQQMGSSGAYGCIVAENKLYRRVRTRAHAEFHLKDGVYLPSQFAGDIVIERETNRIVAIKIAVPPRRNNVDVNWDQQPADGAMWSDEEGNVTPVPVRIVADIGYCEKMELKGGDSDTANQIGWDEELTYREVDKLFQTKFYPAAQIDWMPWQEAVAKSKETGKPLHVVALFGALDDESC